MKAQNEPAKIAQKPEVTGLYSYYVLGVLTLVYVINFVDRQIMAVLIEPIKQEFGVSDTAMGFLSGFAFVFFYTLMGIPIARWADRGSRRFIISLAVALWSIMTVASGLAKNFAQLAVIRIFVGIGEAGGSPPSHSLLSDYFPLRKRATALAVYSWGVYIGAALAFPIGGYLVEHYGWRVAFYGVGFPGLILSLLVWFTIKEPPRGNAESNVTNVEHASLAEVVRFLISRRSFIFIVLGSSLQSLSGFGVITWGAPFLARVHSMSWAEIGNTMGWIIGIAGCTGVFLGGKLADRLGNRDTSWYMLLPAVESFLCIPFIVGFTLLTNTYLAVLCFIPFYFLGAAYVGPMHAMVQSLVRVRMRATASAILLFVVNMVGAGLGPLTIGLLNDHLFGPIFGQEAIRYSMLVVGVIGGFASILFLMAAKSLTADLASRDKQ